MAISDLDEPFSALDALPHYDLQEHLLELWSYDRPTMVLVTHDIKEALMLSNRVVVMRPGRVLTVATPPLPRPRDAPTRCSRIGSTACSPS